MLQWCFHRLHSGCGGLCLIPDVHAGAPLAASNNAKARGADALECLEGLQNQGPSKAAAAGGRLIAKAPPFDPARCEAWKASNNIRVKWVRVPVLLHTWT